MAAAKPAVPVLIAPTARVVDRKDPYVILPAEGLRGTLTEQSGDVVCVTLDGGREVFVRRGDLTVEQP